MPISPITPSSPIQRIKSSPVSLQAESVPVSKASQTPQAPSEGGSFDLKAEIAQEAISLSSSLSSGNTPTSIESLNIDDIQLLQDAETYAAVEESGALVESSGENPFTLTVTKDGGRPAEVVITEKEA